MDYRRSTAQNPEDNCEYYNRMLCRSLAQERKQPVVAFDAVHEGVNHAQGLAMEDSQFNGLAARVELSDEARVILTQNINPGVGLMNGTQATVKKSSSRQATILIMRIQHSACQHAFCLMCPSILALRFFPIRLGRRGFHSFHEPCAMLTIAVSSARNFRLFWVGR